MATTSGKPVPLERASGRRKTRTKQYQTTGSRSIDELGPNSSYAKACALIPPGSRVLDLGCGSGELASYLAARGDQVWGVDANPAALARAAAFCVETRCADLEDVDLADLFPARRFDVVLFADVLEHVREPWTVLQSARGVLDPGGRVVASIPNFGHAAVRLAVVSGAIPYRGLGILDDTHVRFFTLSGIASLFEESGFRLQDVTRTTLPFDQSSDLVPDVRLLRVPGDIERHVRADPENETLQFVVRAVMLAGEWDMTALRGRLHDVEARVEEQAIGLRNLRREHAAALTLAEERGAQVRTLEQAAVGNVRGELLTVTAERDTLATQLESATAAVTRQAELAREAADTFAALTGEIDARRGLERELVRANAALREAIEERDEALTVAADARTLIQDRENESRHDLEGAHREVVELRDALATARHQVRALSADHARLAAATADAEQRAAALDEVQERLARDETRSAQLLAAAEADRAALANAVAHAKNALLNALAERDERAAAAREAQQRLMRHEVDAADIQSMLRAALHAQTNELSAFRERTRYETIVRIAREHADLGAPGDGAQVWRDGLAIR